MKEKKEARWTKKHTKIGNVPKYTESYAPHTQYKYIHRMKVIVSFPYLFVHTYRLCSCTRFRSSYDSTEPSHTHCHRTTETDPLFTLDFLCTFICSVLFSFWLEFVLYWYTVWYAQFSLSHSIAFSWLPFFSFAQRGKCVSVRVYSSWLNI